MKVDSGLCQPAGTPISTQIGCRLGGTLIDVETDILRPIHVSVERIVVFLAHVQSPFNALTLVFSTADATRFARVAFGHFYDFDALDFRFVFVDIREAVERPSVQVQVAVRTPILRFAIIVLTSTSKFTDVDSTNVVLDTPFNDVFGETVEKVSAALAPLVMQSGGFFST